MYKLLSIQTRIVEPGEAEQFGKINNWPGQRKKDLQQARYYKDLMDAERMRNVCIATGESPDGKIKYLMNGQHVCEAIRMRQKGHLATIERYLCETEQDFGALYATFDVQKVRTHAMVIRGSRMFMADIRLREVPIAVLDVCGTALKYLENEPDGVPNFTDSKRSKLDKNAKVEIVDSHGNEVLFVRQFAERKYMINVGTVTAMIASWRANPDKAHTFWNMISTGLGFSGDDHPAYGLREKLLEGISIGNQGGGARRARTYYTYCTLYWNSWVRGETRKRVKCTVMKTVPYPLAA